MSRLCFFTCGATRRSFVIPLSLTWFMAVAEMARFVSPRKRRLSASSSEPTRCMERLRRWQFPSSSSSIVTRGRLGAARDQQNRGSDTPVDGSSNQDTQRHGTSTGCLLYIPLLPPAPSAAEKEPSSRSYPTSLYISKYDAYTYIHTRRQ